MCSTWQPLDAQPSDKTLLLSSLSFIVQELLGSIIDLILPLQGRDQLLHLFLSHVFSQLLLLNLNILVIDDPSYYIANNKLITCFI